MHIILYSLFFAFFPPVYLCAQSATTVPLPQEIILLGDSLTEGYGVTKENSFPSQLQKMLQEDGYKNVNIINAGVSGSTTASAPSRWQWLISAHPKASLLVLCLGANDGLRGIPVKESYKNLDLTITKAQQKGVQVLLVGMKVAPNYGAKYAAEFIQMYKDLAQKYKLSFVPFLLEGVAGVPALNLPDGIHPNEKGHTLLAKTIKDALYKFHFLILKGAHDSASK